MRQKNFSKLLQTKKGEMEIDEIIKLIIAVAIFIVLLAAAIFLLSEKGGEILLSIKNTMKFGR